MSNLSLAGISKHFAGKPVVRDFHLQIEPGEFVSLLGASGCGKTTTLRMIAGLERPDEGAIRFGSTSWADAARRVFVPPQSRAIGMVFQNYALWPHMTVMENVAYPLRIRGHSTTSVKSILGMVHLEHLAERGVAQLSGGQQQRVALARALACEPKLLLLDEPFSNLDVNLRHTLRLELRAIQRRLGLTVVLVTHDQADAFALSDRIVVMLDGRMEQFADPTSVYERPATPFVRDFVGSTVLLDADIRAEAGELRVEVLGGASLRLPASAASVPITKSTKGCISIRPEDLFLSTASIPAATQIAQGTVSGSTYRGSHRELEVTTATGRKVLMQVPRAVQLETGSPVGLCAAPQSLRAWAGQ